MTPDSEREDALRRLLAEAVEPVEPAPGAQARLLARARAQGRKPHRPFLTRWVPAGVATALVIVGVTVVLSSHSSDGSSASTNAGSAAAGAPSQAPSSQERKAPAAASPVIPEALNSQQLSTVTGTNSGAGSGYRSNASPAPEKAAAASPSDLDGDGTPDTVTLQGGQLTAELSRDGSQTVDLPSSGPGARVLGVASLRAVAGSAPVVFVRLRQVGSTATDTLVSVVGGSLVVLDRGSGPVLLTVDSRHGYACNDSALVITGSATPYVVSGADLVAAPELRAAAAAPGKVAGCVTP